MTLPRILVVAGLIERPSEPRLFLIALRRPGDHLELQWEFPGGKVEPGESPEEALHRELREELAIEVEIGDVYAVGHQLCESFEVVMLTYRCRWISGEPLCREVHQWKWISPRELVDLPMPQPDQPVLNRLRRELSDG